VTQSYNVMTVLVRETYEYTAGKQDCSKTNPSWTRAKRHQKFRQN